jgi:hypothetical protein
MNATFDMPQVPQAVRQEQGRELLDWVRAAFMDLDRRAHVLERLVTSTRSWPAQEPEADTDRVITIRVDRDAWFAAVQAAARRSAARAPFTPPHARGRIPTSHPRTGRQPHARITADHVRNHRRDPPVAALA